MSQGHQSRALIGRQPEISALDDRVVRFLAPCPPLRPESPFHTITAADWLAAFKRCRSYRNPVADQIRAKLSP